MRNSPPSSNRSWPTPDGHLALRRSRVAGLLKGVLWLALGASLVLVYRDGHHGLALAAAVYTLACLARAPEPRPRALGWQGEHWYLVLPAEGRCPVQVLEPLRCLPWLIYLHWRRPGQRRARLLCLWPDSADAEGQRRLRKRLRLVGAAPQKVA